MSMKTPLNALPLILLGLMPPTALASETATPAAAGTARDFDYLIGSWKIHLKKLVHPLSGSKEWIEADGTVTCRHIFNGKGEVEEFDVENKAKAFAIHGLAVRLFNAQTQKWSIYWANEKNGAMDAVPQVGGFNGDEGEFLAHDTYEGKPIIIRFHWSRIHSAAPHFEQAFSADDGKSWEVNWITEQTRIDAEPKQTK